MANKVGGVSFGFGQNYLRRLVDEYALDQTPEERDYDARADEQHRVQDSLFARGGYRSCFSPREDGEPSESASMQTMTGDLEF